MASTSITRIGGMMVVTQVIPREESSIQLQYPAPTTQMPAQATTLTPAPAPTPAKTDGMKPSLLQGEPQCLGVIQIFIGVLCMLYSINAVFSLLLYAPFCLAFVFVFAGALTLAAHRKNSIGLVGYALVWNLMGVVVGVAGVAFLCWQLASGRPTAQFCESTTMGSSPPLEVDKCIRRLRLLDVVVFGLRGLLLVLLVLQVCVATTAAVFSCKAISRHRSSTHLKVESGDRSPLLPDE